MNPLKDVFRIKLKELKVSKTIPAILVLADGTVFKGISIGASGHTVG